MATAAKYAQWIVDNQDKKGTPEFDTVARAYQAAKGQAQEKPKPATAPIQEKRQPFADLQTGSGYVMGYSDPAAGLSQLASRIGPDSRTPEMVMQGIPQTKDVINQAIKDREAMYQAPEGFDYKRMTGNVVNPVSAALMGVPVGQAALRGRMAAGAGTAGAYGASMPVIDDDFSGSKRNRLQRQCLWVVAFQQQHLWVAQVYD